jgi:L-seryl-tRNA(Ser) seleniumtransferase
VAGSIPALSAFFYTMETGMKHGQDELKRIPGVDKLLATAEIKELIRTHNADLVKFSIREVLQKIRMQTANKPAIPEENQIIVLVERFLKNLSGKSLKRVINATGVIVNTNLGRAPFGDEIIREASEILKGYNNLEFDLDKGARGSRHTHLTTKLKYLTGAEDVLVVNNNAAAIILILRTLAKNKEVIVSRGELIEIGGSFRIPEIMAASDCQMVEVGSTNKTHLRDYENAISSNTGLIFKAHQSNYVIHGFTTEVELPELVALGKKHKIPVIYDMGSGLLRKTNAGVLMKEPDVRQTISHGVDIVCFSGDKLIGGPQAGVIAGKSKIIARLKKEPLVRALRVGKTTLAYMEAALTHYLDDHSLLKNNMFFGMVHQSSEVIENKAKQLSVMLSETGIQTKIEESEGFCGGGALPGESLPSFSIKLIGNQKTRREKVAFAEKMHLALMKHQTPVVGVLKKGELHFDLLTVAPDELGMLAEAIRQTHHLVT